MNIEYLSCEIAKSKISLIPINSISEDIILKIFGGYLKNDEFFIIINPRRSWNLLDIIKFAGLKIPSFQIEISHIDKSARILLYKENLNFMKDGKEINYLISKENKMLIFHLLI